MGGIGISICVILFYNHVCKLIATPDCGQNYLRLRLYYYDELHINGCRYVIYITYIIGRILFVIVIIYLKRMSNLSGQSSIDA